MDNVISQVLEIFKYVLPAVIVFITAYQLMKKFLNAQVNLESMKLNKDIRSETLPLKLQAYERLMMFCERINVNSLASRLRTKDMTVDSLRNVMVIAVQQEYEHNISQQIFISDPLWNIIQLAKEETLGLIMSAGPQLRKDDMSIELIKALNDASQKLPLNPIDQARMAIKKEVSLLF